MHADMSWWSTPVTHAEVWIFLAAYVAGRLTYIAYLLVADWMDQRRVRKALMSIENDCDPWDAE